MFLLAPHYKLAKGVLQSRRLIKLRNKGTACTSFCMAKHTNMPRHLRTVSCIVALPTEHSSVQRHALQRLQGPSSRSCCFRNCFTPIICSLARGTSYALWHEVQAPRVLHDQADTYRAAFAFTTDNCTMLALSTQLVALKLRSVQFPTKQSLSERVANEASRNSSGMAAGFYALFLASLKQHDQSLNEMLAPFAVAASHFLKFSCGTAGHQDV
jgi:hypothetical protein